MGLVENSTKVIVVKIILMFGSNNNKKNQNIKKGHLEKHDYYDYEM